MWACIKIVGKTFEGVYSHNPPTSTGGWFELDENYTTTLYSVCGLSAAETKWEQDFFCSLRDEEKEQRKIDTETMAIEVHNSLDLPVMPKSPVLAGEIYKILPEEPEDGLTAAQVAKELGEDTSEVSRCLIGLERAGAIETEEREDGKRYFR